MPPENPQMLRDRAAEWERQAGDTQSPDIRETLLHVATRLRAMADEDERRSGVAASHAASTK
jgi:hypothetical protein